jgi:hypothetical protein
LLWLCFGDGILPTICLGWPWTLILLPSASQVAGITGMNYQCWSTGWRILSGAQRVVINLLSLLIWNSPVILHELQIMFKISKVAHDIFYNLTSISFPAMFS